MHLDHQRETPPPSYPPLLSLHLSHSQPPSYPHFIHTLPPTYKPTSLPLPLSHSQPSTMVKLLRQLATSQELSNVMLRRSDKKVLNAINHRGSKPPPPSATATPGLGTSSTQQHQQQGRQSVPGYSGSGLLYFIPEGSGVKERVRRKKRVEKGPEKVRL